MRLVRVYIESIPLNKDKRCQEGHYNKGLKKLADVQVTALYADDSYKQFLFCFRHMAEYADVMTKRMIGDW